MNYTIVELDTLSLSQLVALYNTDAEKPVKAFKTKPVALERCEKLAAGRAVVKIGDPTRPFMFETAEHRETRLAGLSVNEADERDESAFNVVDGDAQEHAVTHADEIDEKNGDDIAKIATKRGPAPIFADDEIIIVLKPTASARRSAKAANWARYELYRDGMKVREYLDAAVALQGGNATRWRGDLIWDYARGNVKFYTARQWANSQAGRDIEDDGQKAQA